jgi:MFS family permease
VRTYLGMSSQQGLDWLNFFVANLQTAFGPFIAVYLTGEHWTQGEIGLALTAGSITAMVSQVPAGAVVDAVANKHVAAFTAILTIIASCLLLGLFPQRLPVMAAEILHGFASCMLNPAIAAITLGMVAVHIAEGAKPGELGRRLGRNASFGSIGNAIAAGLMGGVGYLFSSRATFFLGALLAVPGLVALRAIKRPATPLDDLAAAADPGDDAFETKSSHSVLSLLRDRRLLAFAICTALFHLSNAAMLPLAAGEITKEAAQQAELIIAACILAPQLVVAVLSPHVGRLAETIGRRPVMLVGFAALPVRGLLLATTSNPWLTVLFQLLDGVSAASFGVMLPLIAADLTRGTGRFNLCMGFFGLAVGIGASFSTTLAGFVADRSVPLSFVMLALAGFACVLMVWLLFGDTTPRRRKVAPA